MATANYEKQSCVCTFSRLFYIQVQSPPALKKCEVGLFVVKAKAVRIFNAPLQRKTPHTYDTMALLCPAAVPPSPPTTFTIPLTAHLSKERFLTHT